MHLCAMFRAVLCALLCSLVTSAGMPQAAGAVPDDGDRIPGICRPETYRVIADLVRIGLPLANSTVQVNARNAKLVPVGVQASCYELYLQVPNFRWSIAAAPPGQ